MWLQSARAAVSPATGTTCCPEIEIIAVAPVGVPPSARWPVSYATAATCRSGPQNMRGISTCIRPSVAPLSAASGTNRQSPEKVMRRVKAMALPSHRR